MLETHSHMHYQQRCHQEPHSPPIKATDAGSYLELFMITQTQDLVPPQFQCRCSQMLMLKTLALAGSDLSTSWGQTHQGRLLYLGGSCACQQRSTLPEQPFGHDSTHTRGTQALCHHQIASEKTGSVALEKLLKSSFSIMWFEMLFSESNESTG